MPLGRSPLTASCGAGVSCGAPAGIGLKTLACEAPEGALEAAALTLALRPSPQAQPSPQTSAQPSGPALRPSATLSASGSWDGGPARPRWNLRQRGTSPRLLLCFLEILLLRHLGIFLHDTGFFTVFIHTSVVLTSGFTGALASCALGRSPRALPGSEEVK